MNRCECPACTGLDKRVAHEPCDMCGTLDDVTLEPDPFSWQVYDDDTPRWLCSECRSNRADDI